jgi:hypothetical protein
VLIAIDRNGNELATARQLIPAGYEHPYFYFERGVRTARFKLVDDASQPLAGSLTIRFMGSADQPLELQVPFHDFMQRGWTQTRWPHVHPSAVRAMTMK